MKKLIFLSLFLTSFLCYAQKTWLVFGGKTGWIGQKVVQILKKRGDYAICAESRLENRESMIREIKKIQPDYIISAAGRVGTPNVAWCDDHQQETIRANVIGALNLFDCAYLLDIPVINLGTGCIYEYDDDHPMNSGKGFVEEDEPNFDGSFYSFSKAMLDRLLLSYPNVLNLRLRMPVSEDLHPKNFINKITRYKKLINIPNSITILHDLLPLIPIMVERGLRGNYNFVNPGVMSHNEILQLYKEYIDPAFTWENFTLEEHDRMLKVRRSNNHLDVSKLLKEFPDIPNVKTAMVNVFKRMQEKSKKNQNEDEQLHR